MKNITIIKEIKSKKDLNKVLSNMIKSRIQKDVDRILEGGTVKFIKGGIKKTIREMPEELTEELMEFYGNLFEAVLEALQKDEDFNIKALNKKDALTMKKLEDYLSTRFE